uniref:Uncharacterized protein n=1 Tax=Alexandrium monilatum TaxID=311494 RepID=A0A7S4W8P8_9DINO
METQTTAAPASEFASLGQCRRIWNAWAWRLLAAGQGMEVTGAAAASSHLVGGVQVRPHGVGDHGPQLFQALIPQLPLQVAGVAMPSGAAVAHPVSVGCTPPALGAPTAAFSWGPCGFTQTSMQHALSGPPPGGPLPLKVPPPAPSLLPSAAPILGAQPQPAAAAAQPSAGAAAQPAVVAATAQAAQPAAAEAAQPLRTQELPAALQVLLRKRAAAAAGRQAQAVAAATPPAVSGAVHGGSGEAGLASTAPPMPQPPPCSSQAAPPPQPLTNQAPPQPQPQQSSPQVVATPASQTAVSPVNLQVFMAAAMRQEAPDAAAGRAGPPADTSGARPVSGYAQASTMSRRPYCSTPAETGAAKLTNAEGLSDRPASKQVATELAGSLGSGTGAAASEVGTKGEQSQVYIGNVPPGTAEGLIRAECSKYGKVGAIVQDTEPDNNPWISGWALVSYSAPHMAVAAAERLRRRTGLFGASSPLEVRIAEAQDLERVCQLPAQRSQAAALAESTREDARGSLRLSQDVSRSLSRSGTGRRHSPGSRSRSRTRRRSRSGRSRGGSCSHPRPSSSKGDSCKRRPLGGFDSGMAEELTKAPSGGRQIGVRGEWAQFAAPSGRHYYQNLITGEATWEVPKAFRAQRSSRAEFGQTKVFVLHVPEKWTEKELSQLFQRFGTVTSTSVRRDTTGKHLGAGFISYATCEEAMAAIEGMNGYFVEGLRLKVAVSRY